MIGHRFAIRWCLAGLLAGCADEADLRRWRFASQVAAGHDEVGVQVSLAEVRASPSGLAISALSDQAQAAMVEQARFGARNYEQIRDRVLGPASSGAPPREGQAVSDRATRQLTAYLSQPFETFQPGDRIERARISIRPLNFSFASYSNPEIEITPSEGVEVRRTSSLETRQSITAGAATTGLPVGFEGGSTQSRELQTNTRIRENRGLNILVTPECLQIARIGSRNYNIDGNTSFELTFVTEVPPSSSEPCNMAYLGPVQAATAAEVPYWVIDAPLPVRNGRLSVGASERPGSIQTHPTAALAALVRLDFELRRVVSGQRQLTEGLQTIEQRIGSSVRCVDLLRGGQIRRPLYELVVEGPLPGGRSGPSGNITVNPGSGSMALVFTDYERAVLAARWMEETPRASIGALRLEAYPPGRVQARQVRSRNSPCDGREVRQPPPIR